MDSRRYLVDSSFRADGWGFQTPVYNIAYDCHPVMRDTLTFAPTLETQHFRLVTMRYDFRSTEDILSGPLRFWNKGEICSDLNWVASAPQ